MQSRPEDIRWRHDPLPDFIIAPDASVHLERWMRSVGTVFTLCDRVVKEIARRRLRVDPVDVDDARQPDIDTWVAMARGRGGVVGIGGGRALDAAKAVAFYTGARLALVPTAISTDAPCSRVFVVHRHDGSFDRAVMMSAAADLVLADLQLLAGAPRRLLVSGLADAYAKPFEAREVSAQGGANHWETGAAPWTHALAEDLEAGVERLLQELAGDDPVGEDRLAEAAERVFIESTLVWQSGGLAVAHAMSDVLVGAAAPGPTHGELVWLGLGVQFALAGQREELARWRALGAGVRLPRSVSELRLRDGVDAARIARELSMHPLVAGRSRPLGAKEAVEALERLW